MPAAAECRTIATDFSNSTVILDLEHRGRAGYLAGCLLDCGHGIALLDPGPSATLEVLRRKLHDRGLAISDITTVLLTHIHLDHAGGVGSLVEENPDIQVFVHQRGAAHLMDPKRLLESASRALGQSAESYWGSVTPLPARNVKVLTGGESIALGARNFEVLYTPGHASHHISFFEARSGVAFVGDAAGIRIGNSFVYPATPPPDIDLASLDQSLDLILAREPQRLLLTHFGLLGRVEWHMAEFRDRLRRWSEFVLASLQRPGEDAERAAAFSKMVMEELRSVAAEEEAAWFDKLTSSRQNWFGLARYWRRRLSSSSEESMAI